MVKVILRHEAINDLSDIWFYTITEWAESYADKYYKSIKIACKEIAKNPSIGKNYNEISNHLFGLKTGKHIIFYCIVSEFEIIRILHEKWTCKTDKLNKNCYQQKDFRYTGRRK